MFEKQTHLTKSIHSSLPSDLYEIQIKHINSISDA